MAKFSNIEWTDATYNPWYGCTKVSPACDHCYAESLMDTRFGKVTWGGERRQSSLEVRRAPRLWNGAAVAAGRRRRVFTLSLGDFFDNRVPSAWRTEAWDTIRACQHLDWLILTKRPQNVKKLLPPDWGIAGWPHVWLGVTVEDMVEARRRVPVLLGIPARIHWLSCQPLLEPLTLSPWLGRGRIDWIVVGGETGSVYARPMHPAWARDLREQCQTRGASFFLKQMARRAPIPVDLLVREWPTP